MERRAKVFSANRPFDRVPEKNFVSGTKEVFVLWGALFILIVVVFLVSVPVRKFVYYIYRIQPRLSLFPLLASWL